MQAGHEAATVRWTSLSLAGALLSGLLVSLLSVVLMISFAGMIFSGSLAPFLRQGIGLSLFGGVVLGIVGAFGTSFRGTICHPQDVTGVILALAAAAVAGRVAEPGAVYATVAMLIALASVVTGLAFVGAGMLRLGILARFIPYPVMGGFLASAGFLMAAGAVRMVTEATDLTGLVRPEAVWRWAPVLALGIAMLWVARRSGRALALPGMVVAAFAGFYAWLLLSGVSIAEAGQRGLLLGPFAVDRGFLGAFRPSLLAEADYGALLTAIPALATLVGLAFVGAMLNASAIELGTDHPVDLNRDLRGVGVANLLAGLGGGVTGYHVLGCTLLAHRLIGVDSRWIGVGVGLTAGAILAGGASVLGMLPVAAFAAFLAFLGLDLLYQWLWVERRRLPLPDFLLVLAMLVVSVTMGFLQAIALGVLAASALFVFAYSRLDVVRGRLSGALRLSTTERPEPSTRLLAARGDETLIFELQGYVFFGTAHALLGNLSDAMSRPERPIRNVILDFRRVQGLDASAVFNLGKLGQLCDRHGVRLVFTHLRPCARAPDGARRPRRAGRHAADARRGARPCRGGGPRRRGRDRRGRGRVRPAARACLGVRHLALRTGDRAGRRAGPRSGRGIRLPDPAPAGPALGERRRTARRGQDAGRDLPAGRGGRRDRPLRRDAADRHGRRRCRERRPQGHPRQPRAPVRSRPGARPGLPRDGGGPAGAPADAHDGAAARGEPVAARSRPRQAASG